MSARKPLAATAPAGDVELDAGESGGRGFLRSPAGRLGLAGLLITGLLISLSAAHTEFLLPTSLRPVPRWLAGAFGNVGLDIGLPGLIIALSLMFLSYALAVGATRQLSRRAVLISIAALNALVLVAPPLLSSDLFSYIAYARLGALYGINPYLHGPNLIAFGHLYPLIGVHWTHTPTVYGPLFTAVSYPLAGLGIAANVFVYKGIAALSCLAIVALVWRAARLRGMDPVKAVALVGLNPVIIVYGVGGGHNDLLMLAIMVAGIYVLLRQRQGTGGAMIVAATAVKLTAGMLLPFAVAAGAGRKFANSSRARIVAGAGIAAIVLGVLGTALFGAGPLHLLATLAGVQSGGGAQSVTGFLLSAVGLGRFNAVLSDVLHVGYALTLVWLIRRVWIGELDWITAAGWATVWLLVSAGMLMPWYIAWLIPLAALSGDRRLRLTAIGLTSLGLTSL
ncbi:MAG TPA: polyprenol phosphomannose-dependent alpha 1,6 mannosyltransferase MptB [Solirubrobacteraceae bacterium]|nr:polyprenol phosphomannose-dependent alpha 1,6 mannosyltransferase MptB [Solirubrobacteraceae bacterium]